MPPRRLILASSSVYRRELLARLIPDFEWMSPDVDELRFQATINDPQLLASTLARKKAEAVARRAPDAVVIGSDQVVDLDGTILGKPGNPEAALRQLMRMSGKCHRLLTAVCIVDLHRSGNQSAVEFMDTTTLWMRSFSEPEALRCIERDQPVDCAGSYRIESAGIGLFDRIDSNDFTAIIGLPLLALAGALRQAGFLVP